MPISRSFSRTIDEHFLTNKRYQLSQTCSELGSFTSFIWNFSQSCQRILSGLATCFDSDVLMLTTCDGCNARHIWNHQNTQPKYIKRSKVGESTYFPPFTHQQPSIFYLVWFTNYQMMHCLRFTAALVLSLATLGVAQHDLTKVRTLRGKVRSRTDWMDILMQKQST